MFPDGGSCSMRAVPEPRNLRRRPYVVEIDLEARIAVHPRREEGASERAAGVEGYGGRAAQGRHGRVELTP
jgi:hypothetical protein